MPVIEHFNLEKLDVFYQHAVNSKLWPLLYPRHYHCPQGYAPLAKVSALWNIVLERGQHVFEEAKGKGASTELQNVRVLLIIVGKLIDNQMQTFWVGRSIGQALLATRPPTGILLKDIPLPFSGFSMLLPAGLLTASSGESVMSIAVCSSEDRLCLHAVTIKANGTPAEWFGNFRLEDSFERSIDASFFTAGEWVPEENNPDDKHFIGKIFAFVTNVCFYMVATPTEVDRDTIEGRHKKQGKKIDWWHPRWIAARYHPARGTRDGTHSSPRMHWRRGHWRGQRIGEGRKDVKQTWIEPVLVKAEV